MITVKTEDKKKRLDALLAELMPEKSRSQWQLDIKAGIVLVNGAVAGASYRVKEGDEVLIGIRGGVFEESDSSAPEESDSSNSLMEDIRVVASEKDFLVVDKPAGLVVHGCAGIKEKTLADWVIEKYPEVAGVGDDKERPGIMHRLDREVSGLMVIAKNQESFLDLKRQFKERETKKSYSGLVYGKIAKDEDEINFSIERGREGKMIALALTVSGVPNMLGNYAKSEFEVIKRFINYTFLKIRIHTGRTHQIRCHMSAYGHPLAGDDLYGTSRTKAANKKLDLGRIFLVADELSFRGLDGEMRYYKLDLPVELVKVLEKVK